jgi:hypothetical protein
LQTLLLTGAGGFVGQELLRTLLELYPNLSIIATDIRPPSIPNNEHDRVTSLAADLGDESSLASLFEGKKVDGVFALHGIMSGGSEADMELGYRGELSLSPRYAMEYIELMLESARSSSASLAQSTSIHIFPSSRPSPNTPSPLALELLPSTYTSLVWRSTVDPIVFPRRTSTESELPLLPCPSCSVRSKS